MDLMLKVVRLYYQENLNQNEIAKQLNISRVKVYRLLLKAKNKGVVRIEIVPPSVDFSELEIQIEKKFKIKQCIVVPYSDSKSEIYRRMAEAIVSVLDRYYVKNMKIGIGWGHTIEGSVNAIKKRDKLDIHVYPAIGGSASRFTYIHANSIVSSFVSRLGGNEYSLNCPAIIDTVENKKVILKERSIKKIVDLFPKLDFAIVPIGYMADDVTIYETGEIKLNEIEYLKSLGVVGDINSNFINENGELIPNEVQDRIININLEELKKINNTVALSAGQKKVEATKAALRSGAINILITDSLIAQEIIKI